jgi:hypothetical protein
MRRLRQFAPRSVKQLRRKVIHLRDVAAGRTFALGWSTKDEPETDWPSDDHPEPNRLLRSFEEHTTGRGVHKWRHYFDIYERHLGRFAARDIHLLEVGVQSGGSLEMWKQFLGDGATIYGVDVDSRCTRSEEDRVTVFIGDQADRAFWARFRAETQPLDVVIDDGGHTPEQQRVTMEELLPHLAPGGVYICEDVHSEGNQFLSYVHGLSRPLYAGRMSASPNDPERNLVSAVSPFQASVHSVHLYPFLVVIERRREPLDELVAPRHGTDWLN